MTSTKVFPVSAAAPMSTDDRKATAPLYVSAVTAGFPSPAEDSVDRKLDLHEHLVRHPASTFFVRASGDSMIHAGIHNGDLLVVDRSLEAVNGSIVVAAVEGEMTVKYLAKRNGRVLLVPANDGYPELDVTEQEAALVWGVVTYAIHRVNAGALGAR